MNIDILLPTIPGLLINGITFQENRLVLALTSTNPNAHCPLCNSSCHRVHSKYERKVADLPWADKQVELQLNVRRFFCDVVECKRKIFTERLGGTPPLHPAIAAYTRRTARLEEYLQTLGLLVGGELAALLSELLNICSLSPDTFLNLIRKSPAITYATPKVLGIDEWQSPLWAIRKGKIYATILVDLQTRSPIDLLGRVDI